MKKILIIVAHPDDETIGCGGTIAKHVHNKDKVFCVSFTDGVSSRGASNINKKKRVTSKLKASKILGFNWINNTHVFKDNQLDTYPLIKFVKIIEKIKKKINPDIIYTHNSSDLNIDHKVISNATSVAFRPQPNEKFRKIIAFEIPSSTDYSNEDFFFRPNHWVNISNYWKIKEKALNAYGQEMKKKPHSRSHEGIKNLAKFRGNQSGLDLAESFKIIRSIKR